ncbi:type II secretion system F family protein [Candidatus Saccharibacteria bacterium]|nr:type II secretion system F family protein [Candidatus Saccharibacteria bacterium]
MIFDYKATNKNGNEVTGTVEAADRAGAIESLAKQKMRPISLREKGNDLGVDSFVKRIFGQKVKTNSLVIFTRQLATMVGAGVPLLRALNSLKDNANDPALTEALNGVATDVQSGMPLADAMEKHPNAFNEVYVNMVRAGEAAGILDEILGRLAQQQEKSATIKKKVKGAMTYPTILLVITILAFFGLMIGVIPQIGKILIDLGGPDVELPILTQIMLGISSFLINYWYIVLAALVGTVYGTSRFLRTPKGRVVFHTLLLKMPIVKNIVIKVSVARFARTFASLMGAGVSVVESLRVTGKAIGNALYEETIENSIAEIKNGKQLSETLTDSPLFPNIVSQMLTVGEETGKTDTVLIKVADFYEEEVDVVLDSISSIIEPVMIVIMGSMVGLIAASVMGPIASIAQNIKS